MKTVKELRQEAGLTQRQLATNLGVTIATVSAWERGSHHPSARQLRALASAFGVPMDEIDFEQIGQRRAIDHRLGDANAQ